MKTEAKKHLPQLFQMAALTFASVILLACDGDATGPEGDQSDQLASEASVGSVTGFVTARGEPASGISVIISQDGISIQATAIGPDGQYNFYGLPAGDYDIRLMVRNPFDSLGPSSVLSGNQDALWSVSVYGGTTVRADFDFSEKAEEWERGW